MRLAGTGVFCLLILPMLCRSLETNQELDEEQDDQLVQMEKEEDSKIEKDQVEEKGEGKQRESKQFWPLIHTR